MGSVQRTNASSSSTSSSTVSSTSAGILSDPSRMIELNGRHYIRLNVLGKGGSSSVYRIIGADDGHVYAYKRVEVKDCEDVDAVFDNYANEIALLRKLSAAASEVGVHGQSQSRIIELIDCEVRKDRNYIAMVLEAGDIDLAKVLTQKNTRSNAAISNGSGTTNTGANGVPQSLLDPFFARMVWREMLEAVDHIHTHRIVHGDLKPANFVFVKGHLKLIDFGIAKSFSTDTTNIYRESQIGTINYMAPEAIAPMTAEECEDCGDGGQKMRLGRASDIWSLGCILYQMIYGRPPFAALNTIQKLSTIPNPKHVIKYPEWGECDAVDSIKACLVHDPHQRCKIPGATGLLQKPYLQVSSNSISSSSLLQTESNASNALSVPALVVGKEQVHCIVGAVLDSLSNSAQASVQKVQASGRTGGVSTRNSRSSARLTAEAAEAQKMAEGVVRWIDEVDQNSVEREILAIVEKECNWTVCATKPVVATPSEAPVPILDVSISSAATAAAAVAPTPVRSTRSSSTPQSSAGLPPKVPHTAAQLSQLPAESPARPSPAMKRKFSVSTPASCTRSAAKRAARRDSEMDEARMRVDEDQHVVSVASTIGTPMSKKKPSTTPIAKSNSPKEVIATTQQQSSVARASTWAPVSIAAIPNYKGLSRQAPTTATATSSAAEESGATQDTSSASVMASGTKPFNPKPAFLSNILGSGKLTSFLGPPVKGNSSSSTSSSVAVVNTTTNSSSSSASSGSRGLGHRSPLKALPVTLQQQIQLTAARLNNVSSDGSNKEDRAAKWIKPAPVEENNLHSSLERQLGQLRKLMHWDDPDENVTETMDGSFAFF